MKYVLLSVVVYTILNGGYTMRGAASSSYSPKAKTLEVGIFQIVVGIALAIACNLVAEFKSAEYWLISVPGIMSILFGCINILRYFMMY